MGTRQDISDEYMILVVNEKREGRLDPDVGSGSSWQVDLDF